MSKAILVLNEMPKSCKECPLFDGENKTTWDEEDGRPTNCPLKEAPKPMRYADKWTREMYDRKDVGMYNQALHDCGVIEWER